jgi:hypothetical protein
MHLLNKFVKDRGITVLDLTAPAAGPQAIKNQGPGETKIKTYINLNYLIEIDPIMRILNGV